MYLLKPVSREELVDALRQVGVLAATHGAVMTPRESLWSRTIRSTSNWCATFSQYAGYDVVAAQSGEEGLRVAEQEPPDLVLMDLQLPGIDGTETLHRLRQEASAAGVRSSR